MMVTMIKLHVVGIKNYKTDLASARPPYPRVTKIHGRKVKSYKLDMACTKLGLQTQDYKCTRVL